MGSEILWPIFFQFYFYFSVATVQCLIVLLQDNEKKREKFLTAKYGAHQVRLISDQMLPEKSYLMLPEKSDQMLPEKSDQMLPEKSDQM